MGFTKTAPCSPLYIYTARVGNADRQSTKDFVDSQTLAASIYGGQGRVLSGGSKWMSALPTCGPLELSEFFDSFSPRAFRSGAVFVGAGLPPEALNAGARIRGTALL